MKSLRPHPSLWILIALFSFTPCAQGQILKKLKKRAEKAAERTIERRVEKETAEKTDQVLDSILEPGKGGDVPVDPQGNPLPQGGGDDSNTGQTGIPPGQMNKEQAMVVYSKFDYVPGDELLFFDDFSDEFVGDFPSKWNTNGSGEIITVNDSDQKWLEMVSGYNINFIPDVPNLPEEYTIEFDIMAIGLTRQTSSTAILRIELSDDSGFKNGENFVHAQLPFCQYSPIGITMTNHINNKREIYSVVKADLREEVMNIPHISIAVNKQRFRLWVNEEKHIDIPRIVPPGAVISTLKFHMNNFKDGEERLFISNLKVAEGGLDLRRTLIADGRVSTNGILFQVGSARIQPQSMGIIRQISQVLQQESEMKLNIVGHTDSDGTEESNLRLSQQRAEAVRAALIDIYGIDGSRLSAQGKGESEPVAENSSPDGKAKNRRVEFIKQ